MNRLLLTLILGALLPTASVAGDFAGEFSDEEDVGLSLSLEADDDGEYSGALSMEGEDVDIVAEADGDTLWGEMDDGVMIIEFRARLDGETLIMDLLSPDFPEQTLDTLRFVRDGSEAAVATQSKQEDETLPGVDVIINGSTLSDEQVAGLAQQYGVQPLAGEYWYDSTSGLYGVVGYEAYGFMLPGHDFGEIDRNASNGNTNVFVNGRELPQGEWVIWSYMLGTPIQMGNYWLDAQGNAGYVGNPIPTVNLFMAAMQNSYRGQGGSGDNFWSTRFSAGNSNADNTQGYVSVPGHGPVGYGF